MLLELSTIAFLSIYGRMISNCLEVSKEQCLRLCLLRAIMAPVANRQFSSLPPPTTPIGLCADQYDDFSAAAGLMKEHLIRNYWDI